MCKKKYLNLNTSFHMRQNSPKTLTVTLPLNTEAPEGKIHLTLLKLSIYCMQY